ncbi:DNA-binding transcriptional regulator, XRE-family HTH domain [Anaerosphaera aminiphila DSM 21120]|uniref:DNA-binding transcriptional regulator, XRE-family HTH domain n=2 Tax=Anaerosphaera TaxID=1273095 RepID=A0A1M5R186_9FIRM|nr:DNA-binding transcriptional regulator, XRE-family HTH domain [Anaerosphaera aminiphila DSM 21120]
MNYYLISIQLYGSYYFDKIKLLRKGDYMKINEIIKMKRLELGYTQEQVANFLGVSTPVVSKWESGVTYPDITILPPLARLLNTDLNTLLSFKDDLSKEEVTNILNKTFEIIEKKNYATAFNYAMDIIKEYPNSELLILNLALTLDGALTLFVVENQTDYKEKIELIYEKLIESTDSAIKSEALPMVISKYMQEENYDRAEELINALPIPNTRNKNFYLTKLYFQKNNFSEASKLLSSELIQSVSDVQSVLLTMIQIALKENRIEDARLYADSYKNINTEFDLMKFISYTPYLEIEIHEKNKEAALLLIKSMLKSLEENWDTENSPFYKFLNSKNNDTENFISKFVPTIVNGFETEEEYNFLREDREFIKLIENYKKKYNLE